jgi:hypothetical protein
MMISYEKRVGVKSGCSPTGRRQTVEHGLDRYHSRVIQADAFIGEDASPTNFSGLQP